MEWLLNDQSHFNQHVNNPKACEEKEHSPLRMTKKNEKWDKNMIRIANGGKATVEEMIGSKEINKSNRERMQGSQSGM